MRTKTLSISNENDTVNEWAMVYDGEWRYISIDLLLLSRVSHISSRNLKHSDHRAVIVLFYGFVFCCAVVGVFFSLIWIEKTETHWERHRAQPPMPYICASLWSSSSVLCFSDLFNSVQTHEKKEWKTDAETTKIMHAKIVVNDVECVSVSVCVYKSSSTCISRLCCLIAKDIYIFLLDSNLHTQKEWNQCVFSTFLFKPFLLSSKNLMFVEKNNNKNNNDSFAH